MAKSASLRETGPQSLQRHMFSPPTKHATFSAYGPAMLRAKLPSHLVQNFGALSNVVLAFSAPEKLSIKIQS